MHRKLQTKQATKRNVRCGQMHRRSNLQMIYIIWMTCHKQDSNLRPTDYESVALPTELLWQRPITLMII